MQYLVLSAVIVAVLLFAIAPQIPIVRRLLHIPTLDSIPSSVTGRWGKSSQPVVRTNMERALRPALKPISGAYVRVSSPGHPSLPTPTDAPFPGRFHRIGEQAPLYVSSDLSVAWAELLRALPLGKAGHELPTLVTRLEVKDLVVLDLTDRASLATLGIDISDVMTGDRSRTQRLADVARDMRAEGVLIPSRMAPSNDKLVVFASGLGRVQVVDSEIVGLQLADATPDPVLQELLRQDEQLVQDFVAALNDGRFEEWVGSLGLPDTHISSLRSLAREVYEARV